MNENKTEYQLKFVSADGSDLLTETYKEIKDAYGRIAEFAAFQRLVPEEIDPKLFRLRGYDGGVKVLAAIKPVDMSPGVWYYRDHEGDNRHDEETVCDECSES